jgi:predicted hydrocarbon binding protein
MNPIPIIGGAGPPIQSLSGEVLWNILFRSILTNNIPMSLMAAVLIIASFGYLSGKGLFWRDRLGLFKSENNRIRLLFFLTLGIAISYLSYNISVILGVYGKIGRVENYLINIVGLTFLIVGLLGFSVASINAVKSRILSTLIGQRSVDARALEVLLAARRKILKEKSIDRTIGVRLGKLLFNVILYPDLAKMLSRLRIKNFVDDYLKYIMFYMMNSRCSVKRSMKDQGRLILIEECLACKGVKSNEPACGLFTGFLEELTREFAEVVKHQKIKVVAKEVECKAKGEDFCKIELSWG